MLPNELVDRPEARKVLAVVLDGDPGVKDELEVALSEAARFDVEVRFILIGDENESHFRDLSAAYGVARNSRELAKSVFGALEAAIS